MKSNQITGLLFLCLLLFGCKKEPDNTVIPTVYHIDTDYVSEDIKQNYIFNVGSIWIYKSDNALTDTVKLFKKYHTIDPPIYIHGYRQGNYNERYNIYYQSNVNDTFYFLILKSVILKNPRATIPYINDGWIYFTSYIPGDSKGGTKLIEMIDTLIVQGKLYFDIVKMQVVKDENENYYDTYYYFAPHFGIIRKEIKDSITWNLYESDIK